MNYDWVTWLIYVMLFVTVFALLAELVKALRDFFERNKTAEEKIKSINYRRYKELLSVLRANAAKGIKNVYIQPSEYFLPKKLGKYKGHIPDKRVLILGVKISPWPWARPIVLFVPYSIGDEKLVQPLTTRDIHLNINGIDRYDRWYYPKLRHDSKYKQEDVTKIINEYLQTDFTTAYGAEILPAQSMLSPTAAANINPLVEKRVVYSSAVESAPEEKEASAE